MSPIDAPALHDHRAPDIPGPLLWLRSLLLVAASLYLLLGIWLYVSQGHGDLWMRWLEKSYVLAGIDPLSSNAAVRAAAAHLPVLAPNAGYAPWSYVYAILFAPGSDFSFAADVFFVLNIASFTYLAQFGYSEGARLSSQRAVGQLAAGAAVAFLAVPMAFRFANYGLIVAALLAGMIQCLQRRRSIAAGVCLGLAMVKPQIAALFFFVPLVRANWVTVLVAAALVAGAWETSSLLTGASPTQLLLEILNRGSQFSDAYQGVFAGITALGVPAPTASAIGLLLGALITAALCWKFRSQPLIALAAIPAVMSTVWTYHRTHDLVVLAFLGLAGAGYAVRMVMERPRRASLRWQIALLATPYIPYLNRLAVGYLVPTAIRVLWFAALLVVLTSEAREPRSELGGEPMSERESLSV